MPLLPPTQAFPESATYVKYWDAALRSYNYMHLVERDLPLLYPNRISSQAPGAKTALITYNELGPSEAKHHVYKFLIGVYPESLVYVWRPYNNKSLMFDERIVNINQDLTAVLD